MSASHGMREGSQEGTDGTTEKGKESAGRGREVQIPRRSVWRVGIGTMIEGACHQQQRARFLRTLRFSR